MKFTKKFAIITLAVIVVLSVIFAGFLSHAPVIDPNASSHISSQESSSEPSSDMVSSEESSAPSEPSDQPPESAPSDASTKAPAPPPSSSAKPPAPPAVSSSSSAPVSEIPSSTAPSTPVNPAPAPTPTPAGSYIVGYYTSWARSSGFTPLSLDASKLTHINYAFADISPQNQLVMANPTTDQKNFADLRTLKKQNAHIKTLISVGGWDYSKNFSNAALNESTRETFAQSCVDFILEHGFDGIDLDWEFPVSGGLPGNINRPADKQNFTKLLRAIRNKLNIQSQQDGRPYYLTVAGAPNSVYLNKIELGAVASLVDYIFLMGYDIHGPWDRYADLGAPLYEPSDSSPQYGGSVSAAVQLYLNSGAPASKLVLGMPFYGYQYTVNDGENNGLYSAFSASKSVSYDRVISNYLSNGSFEKFYHEKARVPYLFDGNTFVTYEDEDSISEKAVLARSHGLAGIGAWELSHDRGGNLLSSAYQAFLG